MSLKVITGNIFKSKCQVLVNTVNCVGVMGAGIALECRLRYPEMHERYISLCSEDKLDIGLLWIYKAQDRWILNFPTKKHWRFPSKESYLHAGLKKFCETYRSRGVTSIAFPLLGADKGGISQDKSLHILKTYLENVDLDVEIYRYDPRETDDLYEVFAKKMLAASTREIANSTNLRIDYVEKVVSAIESGEVCQLNQLARVKGVGIKTLEKVFTYARQAGDVESVSSLL